MADRRANDLAACRLVATAQRAAAGVVHALSVREQDAAARHEAEARDQCDAAEAGWQAQLSGPFDPAIGSALGAMLIAACDRADATARVHADAVRSRDAAALRWREHDARCVQLRDLIADYSRRAARTDDDRALAMLADRVSFAWSRR